MSDDEEEYIVINDGKLIPYEKNEYEYISYVTKVGATAISKVQRKHLFHLSSYAGYYLCSHVIPHFELIYCIYTISQL